MIPRGSDQARDRSLVSRGYGGPHRAPGLAAWLAVRLTAGLAMGLIACGGPQPLVVTGAGVIDGTGAVWESGRVVVVDELISCVGSVDDCEAPARADVLDAEGFWVIPGLIDVDIGTEDGTPDEQLAYLRFLLGVTTGGNPGLRADAADAPAFPSGSDDRRIPVPRETPAAGSASVFGEAILATRPPGMEGPPPSDARNYGVWLRSSSWTSADPRALSDSARAAGARGAHLAPRLLMNELWAGPYRLPHGLHTLLEHPLVTERLQDRILPDRTEAEAAQLGTGVDVLRRYVREFHEAGGVVATASGGALAPGLSIHEEMRALVDAGLSPEDALYAATRGAAAMLGLSESRGTLEVGKLGDFVIVEGDPRVDIAHTQTVSRVVKGGVLYDPPTLFAAILHSPGNRVVSNPLRLVVGTAALLITLLTFWWAMMRHRRSLPPRLVP